MPHPADALAGEVPGEPLELLFLEWKGDAWMRRASQGVHAGRHRPRATTVWLYLRREWLPHRTGLRETLSSLRLEIMRVFYRLQGKVLVHFLHVGKTGGSAVKHTLKHYHPRGRVAVFLHGHKVTLRDIPEGEGVIFFLRDPISRFISSFYSRQREGRPRYIMPWTVEEREAFEYFRTPGQLAEGISSANLEERDRAHKAMRSIQHVRSSYWDWFEGEDYFRSRLPDIFFIGFQERLTEDFLILRSKLELPDHAELPDDEIISHRSPPGLDKTLRDQAIENLKKWYEKDFEFVRLCEEVLQQRSALRTEQPVTLPL